MGRAVSISLMFLTLFTCTLLSPLVFADQAKIKTQKYNVLMIAVDDLNDWVGCLDGHPDAKTPNIDRLAERGVLFTNAHCQAPICNPSRTSFMTGLRPSTTGIYMNSPWFRATPRNKDRVTLTQHSVARDTRISRLARSIMARGPIRRRFMCRVLVLDSFWI